MSTIVTRAGKGSPLTHTEVDSNFTNLNTDKYQSGNNASFGTLSASGAFSANGGATLGDASGDALTINSSAVSIPNGLNFDSNTLVIDASNNRVGINTASPQTQLQISDATTATFRLTSIGTANLDLSCSATTASVGSPNGIALLFNTLNTERMRITSAGNVGIGTNNPATILHAVGSTIRLANTAGTRNIQLETETDRVILNSPNGSLAINTAGSERMRIDGAGNVGIGTSSPSYRLDVSAATGSTQSAVYDRSSGSSASSFHLRTSGTGASEWFIQTGNTASGLNGALRFYDQGNSGGQVERMRLDSSGNLGLGVTPSAWNSGYRMMQFSDATGAFVGGSGYASQLGSNCYINSSSQWIYGGSTYRPARYQQFDSTHYWYTAPSGTAGNAITFTQAMTLDASGRLGIGTTSPERKLHVSGADTVLRLQSSSSGVYAEFTNSTGAAYMGSIGGSNLYFETSGAERMRIDSSGNLLVGTTTATHSGVSSKCILKSSDNVLGLVTDSGNTQAVRFTNDTTAVGSINLTTSATSYATSSDYRLKHDIAPMTGALVKVAALNPVTYKWNADDSESHGFIAHELQAVVPECVVGEKDAVDEEGNPQYQGIDTSFLTATLTAAIQELHEIVKAQAVEIAELKAKI